jgi:hypothetical protein
MLIEIAETHLAPPGKRVASVSVTKRQVNGTADGAGRVELELGKVTNAVTVLRTAHQ